MANAVFDRRRICVVGDRLAPIARDALAGAQLETVGPDAFAELASGARAPDLVLIDADSAAPDLLVAAIEALAQRPRPAPVIVAGGRLPANVVRALFKLERSDVLEAPFSPDNLARIAAKLLASAPAASDSPAQCWSVVSAAGGAGATTIAIEIAAALATEGAGRRVCLIDLNLADGAASAFLGVSPAMHLAEAAETPERIDGSLLQAFAVSVPAGFDLLAAPRNPHAFSKVSAEAVLRLLEVACQTYGAVVVDLPRLRQPWTVDVLAGCDEVMVVSELTVPALLASRALVGEIEAELIGRKARLVVNRLASRVFGPVPSLAEAEKALQRKADGGITSDWEAAAASVNLGGCITQHRPKSKIVSDVKRLVERLQAAAPAAHAA
jgi:pilus assembly protein CpaE